MASYNLTEEHKHILRQLVRGIKEGKLSQTFLVTSTNVGWVLMDWKGNDHPKLEYMDLQVLDEDRFLSLRVTGYSRRGSPSTVQCTLRQKAFDAVANDFELPDPVQATGSVIIGNFINTMMGGNVQGAAGSYITMNQSITDDLEILMQRFSKLADQLTEVLAQTFTGEQLRDAITDVSAVQAQVQSDAPDVDLIAVHTQSLGERILAVLDIGDKLGGSIQAALYASNALIVLGGWASTAYQILQRLVS